MAGCFGGSAIDCWMESNLDRHLEANEFGNINVTFKMFKGKTLIDTYKEEIPEEDGPFYSMKAVLRNKYKDWGLRSYLYTFNMPTREWVYCQETGEQIYFDRSKQDKILDQWEKVPKSFHIVNKTFNVMRMGKYSITCYYPED